MPLQYILIIVLSTALGSFIGYLVGVSMELNRQIDNLLRKHRYPQDDAAE